MAVLYNWTAGLIGQWIKREWDISYTVKGITMEMAEKIHH
ncbi:winged helix-turn-helix domain-containing protein [Aneurinibacillus danicus]|jgi:putative transposase